MTLLYLTIAFVLGIVVTWAWAVRTVEREVPASALIDVWEDDSRHHGAVDRYGDRTGEIDDGPGEMHRGGHGRGGAAPSEDPEERAYDVERDGVR